MNAQKYTKEEALAASLEFFEGNELQASVFIDKYALKDREGNYYERTYADMARRLAREFARIEQKYPNPMSEDEIFLLLTTGGSFVTVDGAKGLKTGVIGPQGSPMYGIGNPFQIVSTSNCAVWKSPEDNISGIMHVARDMANLYKRRFGVGIDISTLRPDGATVRNAASTSTGAWSFADLYSYVTRMIGQNSRRGALMVSMDVTHPDIEKFITMKADLTKVTGANVSVRVSDAFMEAVVHDHPFTLQWPCDVPLNEATVTRDVHAKDIFNLIAEAAAKHAEPGLLFWDELASTQPLNAYPGFEITSVNPCAEIALPVGDSCRLISIYLPAFVANEFRPTAYFDFHRFQVVVAKAQRLMDDLVDLELEALHAIKAASDTQDERDMFDVFIQKCEEGRRTGLGTHGLADALARLREDYGSDDALYTTSAIYDEFKLAAYQSSIVMAKERGAFPIFNWDVEKSCPFFARFPVSMIREMASVGRRNGVLLTGAPTGTRSLLSDNCSSGIEPVFANSYSRNRKIDKNRTDVLVDQVDALGDSWKSYKVFHPNITRYLKLAYEAPFAFQQEAWGEESYRSAPSFETFAEKIAVLPSYFVTANDLHWEQRIHMQAAIQEHTDHSLSSTINLQKGTTAEAVAEIYMAAWKAKLKGVTVYVDGSREAQVLTADVAKEDVASNTPKDPILHDIHIVNNLNYDPASTGHHGSWELKHGAPAYTLDAVEITDGTRRDDGRFTLYDWDPKRSDYPLEVPKDAEETIAQLRAELGSTRALLEDKGLTKTHRGSRTFGPMEKTEFTSPIDGAKRKVYVYIGYNDNQEPVEAFVVDDKGDEDFHAYAEAVGRLVSLALKHGVHASDVVDTLDGLKGGAMSFREGGVVTSVPDLVAKLLRAAHTAPKWEHTLQRKPPTIRFGATTEFVPASEGPDLGTTLTFTENPTKVVITQNVQASWEKCPNCGERSLMVTGGCANCTACGWSRC